MMKKLLITGFAPFGGGDINPSWQAVQALPETIGVFELHKMEIPTVFADAAALQAALELNTLNGVLLRAGED
jgi:pyroglutamyl-peptidase